MAQRRMFSLKIVDSDSFLDMPISARLLYFDLCMRADDDGFISSPKKIMRMTGASHDDFKILIVKEYILTFDSGICVVKHWKIHNLIRSDRYQETIFKDEKKSLKLDENKAYQMSYQMSYQMETQVRLGKDSIVKDSIDDDDIYINKEVQKEEKPIIDNNVIKFYNNNFGLITSFIAQDIEHFLNDGVEESLIIELMKCALKNNVKKWNYVSKSIINNLNLNIKTLDQYEAHEVERENTKKTYGKNNTQGFDIKSKVVQHNFDQRQYGDDYYDQFISNKQGGE